jgi:hypothetical protein
MALSMPASSMTQQLTPYLGVLHMAGGPDSSPGAAAWPLLLPVFSSSPSSLRQEGNPGRPWSAFCYSKRRLYHGEGAGVVRFEA